MRSQKSDVRRWRKSTRPITLAICRRIPTLDFNGDPADEVIAATSIIEGAPLVTRDRQIRRPRLVPLAI